MPARPCKPTTPHVFSWLSIRCASAECDICPICFDEVEADSAYLTLKCAHSFHLMCIAHWFHIEPKCPLCRVVDLRALSQIQTLSIPGGIELGSLSEPEDVEDPIDE